MKLNDNPNLQPSQEVKKQFSHLAIRNDNKTVGSGKREKDGLRLQTIFFPFSASINEQMSSRIEDERTVFYEIE